eukprot:TRINITY_DN59129_c0_g1_i1.p1 TRINITY_DN59129_c0_g1~~TRINITY_DN59129_c0_g1_i1.p1  ORF type:complete len:829 (-),score=136.99 TRINITY_DN59129_c0_g1_i1:49-2535(-)
MALPMAAAVKASRVQPSGTLASSSPSWPLPAGYEAPPEDGIRASASELVAGAKSWADEQASRLEETILGHMKLLVSAPLVALMLREQEEKGQFEVPNGLQVYAQGKVDYYGSPRSLVLCHLSSDAVGTTVKSTPAAQLMSLQDELEVATRPFRHPGGGCCAGGDGPWLWPLHGPKISKAILGMEEIMMAGFVEGEMQTVPWWKRALYWLRIYMPKDGGPFLKILEAQYGPGVAFEFASAHLYTQQLWALAAVCVLCLCLNVQPSVSGFERAKWETFKVLMVFWAAWVLRQRQQLAAAVMPEKAKDAQSGMRPEDVLKRRSFMENPAYHPVVGVAKWLQLLKMACVATPVLAAFFLCVNVGLMGITQLLVFVIYDWGDCARQGCDSPQDKHGFAGFLAEIGVDIICAIFLVVFLALSKEVAVWVATLRNYRYLHRFKFSVEMLTLIIHTFDRIGIFGIFAFYFLPQWEEPPNDGKVDMSRSCDDLFLGDGSFFCLQRRLPASHRRSFFQRFLIGPFCIEPFVLILVEGLLPPLAQGLEQCARKALAECWPPCRSFLFCVLRILALIFYYDGDNIGCLRFVQHGWPFSDLKIVVNTSPRTLRSNEMKLPWEELAESVSDAKSAVGAALKSLGSRFRRDKDKSNSGDDPCAAQESQESQQTAVLGHELGKLELLDLALRQGVRRPHEPLNELLELDMHFLWLLFFAPILPLGVLLAVVARVIKVKMELTKMLFVSQRSFPEPDSVMRKSQQTFMRAATIASIGWSAGLSLLTYNDELWRWGWGKAIAPLAVVIWLTVSAGFALAHADVALLGVVIPVTLLAVGCFAGGVLT